MDEFLHHACEAHPEAALLQHLEMESPSEDVDEVTEEELEGLVQSFLDRYILKRCSVDRVDDSAFECNITTPPTDVVHSDSVSAYTSFNIEVAGKFEAHYRSREGYVFQVPKAPTAEPDVERQRRTITSDLTPGVYYLGIEKDLMKTLDGTTVDQEIVSAVQRRTGTRAVPKCEVFYRVCLNSLSGQTVKSREYFREKARNNRTVQYRADGRLQYGEVLLFCSTQGEDLAVLKLLEQVDEPIINVDEVTNVSVKETLGLQMQSFMVQVVETNMYSAVPKDGRNSWIKAVNYLMSGQVSHAEAHAIEMFLFLSASLELLAQVSHTEAHAIELFLSAPLELSLPASL
ncbi:Hypp6596 [Branchiostoma lanceolatum]|uniref:Hypp6596 protein n=1 Tax=Branchiostoma lanceolatum TaxID=7740 RepID=A0A8K0EAY4_BRALA|nr:Hypp6596 [Branchiostoma lanceolatum]